MLGAGFRRGANAGFRTGRILLSRRAAQQQQRSMAMGVCLAHKVSLCNVAGVKSVFGQGFVEVEAAGPQLGLDVGLLETSVSVLDTLLEIMDTPVKRFISDNCRMLLSQTNC